MITQKFFAQKSNQNTRTGLQLQIQSTSNTFFSNLNNTEPTASISPPQVTGISISISLALILVLTKPLQVPTKTIRSMSDIYNEANTTEELKSQHIISGVTSHQFHNQNSANLPISQCNRTQINIPMYNPFTDDNNQMQNNQTVANQSNRSNDQTFMLNTKTAIVPTLPRPPLLSGIFVDT